MKHVPQIHLSTSRILRPDVTSVKNRKFVKPVGGLWTSSYVGGTCAWFEWCRSESFGQPETMHAHLLEPQDAKIYVVNSLVDLIRLLEIYGSERIYPGSPGRYPDFENTACHYDAIHLTDAGQWASRLSLPDSLYGWDCESTLWFRWKFSSCRVIELQRANDPELQVTSQGGEEPQQKELKPSPVQS